MEVVLEVVEVVLVVYAMVSCPGGVSGNRSTGGTVSPGVPGAWQCWRPAVSGRRTLTAAG